MLWENTNAATEDITMNCSSFSNNHRIAELSYPDTMDDDVSFYGDMDNHVQQINHQYPQSPSALSSESSPQRFTIIQDENTQNLRMFAHKLHSIDEIDCNSMDSGFISQSSTSSSSRRKSSSTSLFHSMSSSSVESMDDDFMDLMALDDEQSEQSTDNLPTNLSSLINSSIITNATRSSTTTTTTSTSNTPEMKRPSVRRCLSLHESNTMRARSLLFEPKTPEILRTVQETTTATTTTTTPRSYCFKRPEPPTAGSPIQCKRYKTAAAGDKENALPLELTSRPTLRKCISMNDSDIMTALSRPNSEPDLIGDHSKPFVLPLIKGRHNDLKSITCDTVAKLVRGEFNDRVASYKIIDCRYPYEFIGGHIRGAQNLYTQDLIMEELVNKKTEQHATLDSTTNEPKRHILVFHCEFSSERGPKMSRFLRNFDRNANEYPALQYPEVYLLHNGYKEFFENYADLCDPIAYRMMLDPSFGDDLRHFRSKSKSWNGEAKCLGGTQRLKKSRSRLVL